MQGHTAIAIRGAGKEGMRELALQLVGRARSALRFPQHLERNGWRKVLFEQTLMGRRVIGSDEDLVHLFQLGGCGGQRKLIVKQAALDIEVGLHQIHIAFAVGTYNEGCAQFIM